MKKILLMLLICISSYASAESINGIVFFGDSLSDNGNFYRQTRSLLPKSPPYYYGRFSNGPVWSELVANYFQKNHSMFISNYAVGGAMVLSHHISNYAHPFLRTEINTFFSENQDIANQQTLYVIWIGENDYIDMDNTDNIELETTTVVENIQSALDILTDHGAQHFLIFNLPDLSKTPLANSKTNTDKTYLSHLIQTHNKKLFTAIQRFKTLHPNIQMIYHDIYTDFNAMLQHPQSFSQQYNQHLTDSKNSCWTHGYFLQKTQPSYRFTLTQTSIPPPYPEDPSPDTTTAFEISQLIQLFHETPCTTPNTHLFWDKLHPSAATHQIIAQIAEKALAAENIK